MAESCSNAPKIKNKFQFARRDRVKMCRYRRTIFGHVENMPGNVENDPHRGSVLGDVRVSCYWRENAGKLACQWAEQAKMRILGIDPGLRTLGWGVIDAANGRLSHVANGQCQTKGTDLALRLLSLHSQLSSIVAQYQPDAAAVEQTFVNKDGAGSLKLGQARGIAMLVPAQAGLSVGEYAPNAVKKAVVGVGHADKKQVEHMVRLQLPGCAPVGPDAADALAIAICHSFHAATAGRLAAAIGAGR